MRKPMTPSMLIPNRHIFIDLQRLTQSGFAADLRSLEADSKKDRIPTVDHAKYLRIRLKSFMSYDSVTSSIDLDRIGCLVKISCETAKRSVKIFLPIETYALY